MCRLNSDCRQPLVCIAALCHVQCVETRDCPAGQRCVVTSDGNVCQLQSESHCVRNSDCISPLVCARDLACRYPCKLDDDCLPMQVCTKSGVCADLNELDSNGDLPAR